MDHQSTGVAAGRQPHDRDSQQRDLGAELDRLVQRVDQLDRRNVQLKNTLRALARESAHISLGGACPQCAQSLMLVKEGGMRCPECGFQQSL